MSVPRLAHVLGWVLAFLALPVQAAADCKDVKVSVLNKHPSAAPVKVISVEYMPDGDKTWTRCSAAEKVVPQGLKAEASCGTVRDLVPLSFRVTFLPQPEAATEKNPLPREMAFHGNSTCGWTTSVYTLELNKAGTAK